MRWIGWFLLFLVGVGWLASQLPPPRRPARCQREPDCWRRTRNGWEPATWLGPEIPVRRPALHPGVVGLLQLLLSLLALTAFGPYAKGTPTVGRRLRTGLNGGTSRPGQARPPHSQVPGHPARSQAAPQSRLPGSG